MSIIRVLKGDFSDPRLADGDLDCDVTPGIVADTTDGSDAEKSSISNMIQQFATLSTILRIVGAFSVGASMSVFLLQGWDSGNDLSRYYLLLSQTLLLAAGGFSLSYLIKENKGARVFFGLGLLSISANFTTLGALIYSYTQWDSGLTNYPAMAQWLVGDTVSLTLALGSAALVLIPVTLFGFMVMARRSALLLSIVFLLSNALLMIPLRDSLYAALLAGGIVIFALSFTSKLVSKDVTLRTPEGLFARLILFVPAIILLVRNAWLYQSSEVLYTVMALISFMTLRTLALQLANNSNIRLAMELVSLPISLTVAFPAMRLLDELVAADIALPSFALIASFLLVDVGRRTGDTAIKLITIYVAAFLMSTSFLVYMIIQDTLLSGLLCGLAGCVVMVLGYTCKQRTIMIMGAIAALLAMAYEFYTLFGAIDLYSWTSLSVIGVSAIVIGSLIERHGVALKFRISQWLKHFEKSGLENQKV